MLLFQCPTSGSSHFYSGVDFETLYKEAFQCPTSGSSHFYICGASGGGKSTLVSMPYFGLIPFLRIATTVRITATTRFQCPTSGSSHFYASHLLMGDDSDNVSMPYFGLIPFLRYPLSTPDKIGISRHDFRGYFTEYSEN